MDGSLQAKKQCQENDRQPSNNMAPKLNATGTQIFSNYDEFSNCKGKPTLWKSDLPLLQTPAAKETVKEKRKNEKPKKSGEIKEDSKVLICF